MQGRGNAGAASAAKKKTADSTVGPQASGRRLQVAAASGVGGAMVVGTGYAGVGFLAGGAVGVAAGVVPALFTFGLSIPVFGAIGAGCGAAFGGAVGGTVGFTGAGAIGYHVYPRRAAIGRFFSGLRSRLPGRTAQPSDLSQDLAKISAKLDTTDTWSEIKDLRDQIGTMQKSIDQQLRTARKTKRMSLSNLSEKLTRMDTSLGNAQTSWTPWADLNQAKEHLRQAQDIAILPPSPKSPRSPRSPRLVGA